jgi:hypothetical protein
MSDTASSGQLVPAEFAESLFRSLRNSYGFCSALGKKASNSKRSAKCPM